MFQKKKKKKKKKKNSMCTLHIENPSNSVSIQAVQKKHKIISIQYNNKSN